MNSTTTDVLQPQLAQAAPLPESVGWPLTRHLLSAGQLLMAVLVVQLYSMESPAFRRVFALAAAGFVVNLALPLKYRLPFFVGLSLAGAVVVFGFADAAWLVACGMVLIGICHLPLSFRVRVVALVVAGTALAVSRAGLVPSPWSSAVWPILGSMFMFRLVLYMLGTKGGRPEGGVWASLAYFFMLPNLVFPLFPVVDYQTFRRTHYDRKDTVIYEQGLLWIARGLVHLLMYRFVYHSVLNDPTDVVRLGDLVQFMVGTFLLYLRVSGQFHLIVGILHLFGFRLPETHKLYYLAHSFTELWRRINIYWTDFMMKAVFYPAYFRLKRLGPTRALVLSTVAVFATTWVLHSYQWFWLRGGFPLTLQDVLFWGVLGALVIRGAVRESTSVKKPRAGVSGWSWRLGLRAAATFGFFCFLWSLWSTESVSDWIWMFGAAARVDVKGTALLAGLFTTLLLLGGRDWNAAATSRPRWVRFAFAPQSRTVAPLAVLIVLAQPAVQARVPHALGDVVAAMRATGLNARDAALQHRGYYEQLEQRGQRGAVERAGGEQRGGWDNLASIGVLRERNDLLTRDLLPSRVAVWNGKQFTTNQWGMRDREYPRDKPDGTLRIALLGPSHVMGNGVADGETFEALVEDRLNTDFTLPGYRRFEILNFAVDGYSLMEQVALLEDRVFRFSPDVVIATHYYFNRPTTERYLLKLIARDVPIPYEPIRHLMTGAGLVDVKAGRIPVPFSTGRRLTRWFGFQPRMPEGEASARVRWIGDDVLAWSFKRFAEVTASKGAVPVILVLNQVLDDEPQGVPQRNAIERAGLPLLNLLGIYTGRDLASLRVAPWDEHPNRAGHQLIADRLYPELTAFLVSHRAGERASANRTNE